MRLRPYVTSQIGFFGEVKNHNLGVSLSKNIFCTLKAFREFLTRAGGNERDNVNDAL